MGEHLGIGLTFKNVPFFFQSGFQQGIIFNNAIMNQRNAAVTRLVRVSIDVVWSAVGGPTRMANSRATTLIFLRSIFNQFLYFTLTLVNMESSIE